MQRKNEEGCEQSVFSLTHARANVSTGKENGEIKRGSAEGEEKRGENHGGLTAQKVLESIPIPPPLRTNAFITAWADWIEFRLECGRIYRWATTVRCFRQTMRKIERFGHDEAIAAIDQSIELGYRGVFEPRTFHKEQPTKNGFNPDTWKPGACL